MKTLSNILIMILGALFFVPKVINKPKLTFPDYSEISEWIEPYEVRKKKQVILNIQSEIKIIFKEVELQKSKDSLDKLINK